MIEVKVSFYLKRNEEKADGAVPVLGRIRIGKSMVQFSAKVSVPISLWDITSGRATGKSKTALSVNASLDKTRVAIHNTYRDLLVKKENVSALEVKNAFQGIASEKDTLVKCYEAHNEQFLKSVGVNQTMETCKCYGVSLAHLKRFMRKKYNVSDIPLQAIIPSFVADYDCYLRVELRLAPQTIVNIIGQLRRIVKIAINNGQLRNDPFIGYEFITSPVVPKSLTSAELRKLMKAKLSHPNLNFIRDMFLFSSFTGIAFNDMRGLTEQNLSIAENGVRWIHLKRKKTGTPCHIPLLESRSNYEEIAGQARNDNYSFLTFGTASVMSLACRLCRRLFMVQPQSSLWLWQWCGCNRRCQGYRLYICICRQCSCRAAYRTWHLTLRWLTD